MGQYPINIRWANIPKSKSKQCSTIGQGPTFHDPNPKVQYRNCFKVSIFNISNICTNALSAPQEVINKTHPFAVGFDEKATCTEVHPPPKGP